MSDKKKTLTPRELEILTILSTGRTVNSIAISLHISQNTMKTHLKNIYRKLEVGNRSEATEKAKSLGLVK